MPSTSCAGGSSTNASPVSQTNQPSPRKVRNWKEFLRKAQMKLVLCKIDFLFGLVVGKEK